MLEQAAQPAYSRKRRLSEDELATWRAFVRAHDTVTRRLERELEQAGGLTLSELDVLITLERAERHTVRLTDLATRVLLTKSGITRLVDRLEEMGLVERRPCPVDRRGLNAVLTAKGRAAHRRTIGVHLRSVAAAFSDHVTGSERAPLRAALERIAGQA